MKNESLWFRRTVVILLALTGLAWIAAAHNLAPVFALAPHQDAATATPQPVTTEATAAPTPSGASPHASGDCLGCHGNEKMTGKFKNGDVVSLYILPVVHKGSFHNQQGMSCIICHQDQKEFPHKGSGIQACAVCHWQQSGAPQPGDKAVFEIPYDDKRALSLSLNDACKQCHSDQYNEVKESAHTRILNEGNRYAPVCVDCHNGHDITAVDRVEIAKICSKCHEAEYSAYRGSVHGSALEKNSNPDVPTCENCHGAHKVTGPRESEFRGSVAADLCGKCHADKALMEKYGLSTDVLSTYMDDVHGRTDILGRLDTSNITPATCYDCHGIHNILSPDNPYSRVYPNNLQKTCQQCHKDANITFPESWLSHKKPSFSSMPGLYITNLASLGGVVTIAALIVVFMLLDTVRRYKAKRIVIRFKKEK